jgi:DNA-binding CsgD family transcriptional regulator
MAKLPEQAMPVSYKGRIDVDPAIADDHGVIMLSHARQILYINPIARRLLHELRQSDSHLSSPQQLPAQLAGLCQTLQGQLEQHSDREEWKHVQIQQTITTSRHRMVLRGCALPGESSTSGHRILIFIEATSDAALSPASHKSPQLSLRQQAIVDGLIRGLSNKLIAEELKVSEYTVKEYLRTIMLKMQVCTRGAVIACFLRTPAMAAPVRPKRASRTPLVNRVTTT